jgi:hypothetical protein
MRACKVNECGSIEEAMVIKGVTGNCSCLDELKLEAFLFLHSIEYNLKSRLYSYSLLMEKESPRGKLMYGP